MTTPAGWYDDGHGGQRWWDGSQWTEHVAPQAPPVAAAGVGAYATPGYYDPVASVPAPKRKVGLFVGLGVVALLVIAGAVAAVLYFLKSGGGDSDGADTPEAAVEGVFTALAAQDCESAVTYFYGSTSQDVSDCEASLMLQDTSIAWDVSVTGADVDGDTASVHAVINSAGAEFPLDVATIKRDGRWYIDDSAGLLGGGSADALEDTADDADADAGADDEESDAAGGEIYTPGAVDFSDPMSVAGAFMWSNFATNDCEVNYSTIDPAGLWAAGQSEAEFCADWGDQWEVETTTAAVFIERVDNADGTVSIAMTYEDSYIDVSMTMLLQQVDGAWLVEDVTNFA